MLLDSVAHFTTFNLKAASVTANKTTPTQDIPYPRTLYLIHLVA